MSTTSPDSASRPHQALEVKLFVRVRLLRGEADLELNGKTGWIAPDSLLVRVIPESPDAAHFALVATPLLAEVCYSTDQRVIPIEGIIAKREVRDGYLKLHLDVRDAHPLQRSRWGSFVEKFARHLARQKRRP
jgi:hypothetical protein